MAAVARSCKSCVFVEFGRLLRRLIDCQMAYQDLLRSNLEAKQLEIQHVRLMMDGNESVAIGDGQAMTLAFSHSDSPTVTAAASAASQQTLVEGEAALMEWARNTELAEETIVKLVSENYCLHHLLHLVTREELNRLKLRGGDVCRIWEEVEKHRRQPRS